MACPQGLQIALNASGLDVVFNEPLSKHTYLRIGGPAWAVVNPRNVDDLKKIAQVIRKTSVPFAVIGAGSNLLVSDDGFEGIVIKTKKLGLGIEELSGTIRAGAGVPVSVLLSQSAQKGWKSLEFLTGIPGTLGGVVAMNGGTHLGEAVRALQSVEVFSLKSGSVRTLEGPDLKFAYRKNFFLNEDDVVVSTVWRIEKAAPESVRKSLDEVLVRRKSTQPLDRPSCGSTFKNPGEVKAWQIIDRLGLRGHRIGNAQFSEKHCNFILNLSAATAADVRGLIELAKTRARDELGVILEEEVKYLGRF